MSAQGISAIGPPDQPAILSLFSGCGGLDLGFRAAGYETILALDSCNDAVASFNTNLGGDFAKVADLSTLSPSEFLALIPEGKCPVGLVGGPPCQGFSIGNTNTSVEDSRNQLPFRYCEYLEAANRKFALQFFVFENVVGLKQSKFKEHYAALIAALSTAGFNCFESELNASNFGVAQRRRRLFIVGINRELGDGTEFIFPTKGGTPKTVRDLIKDLPDPVYFRRGLMPSDIGHHSNHWAMLPKSAKFGQSESALAVTGRSFRRVEWDEVSPTVAYGHREVHVHPSGRRRLSIYEAMLLQGFSERERLIGSLSSQITQVSNAVPPPVSEAIAQAIRGYISAHVNAQVEGQTYEPNRT